MLELDLQSCVPKPRLLCLPLKGKEKEGKKGGRKEGREGGREGEREGERQKKRERKKSNFGDYCYSQTPNLLFVKTHFKVNVN